MAFPRFLRIATLARAKDNESQTENVRKLSFVNIDDELINILSRKLRFSYERVSPSDGEYGRLLSNGQWSGLVGMVANGEADLIVNRLSISIERTEVIDFSTPYSIEPLTFGTRNPEHSLSVIAYLQPFSASVWLAIMASVIITTATSYALLKKKNANLSSAFSIFDKKSPTARSEYVLKFCWVISTMLLKHFYTGVLLSFLTVPSLSGVRTIAELSAAVSGGKYRCFMTPGASFATTFLHSNHTDLKIIGKSAIENRGSNNIEEILNNTESPVKPAFIVPQARLLFLQPNYFVSEDGFFINLLAMGVKKGFCCKSDLNRVINYVWAGGIYDKLKKDAAFIQSSQIKHTDDNKLARPLSVEDFQGEFILLVAGNTLAMVVMFLEIILHKKNLC